MKKALSLVLVMVLMVSLCACGKGGDQSAAGSTSGESVNNQTEGSSGATQGTTENSADLTTGSTESQTEATTATTAPAPTACSHSFSDATCTAPKTCTKCGETQGEAAGHSWKDATCSAPKTCTKCDATEGSAAAHSFADGVCSVCGEADPTIAWENARWEARFLVAEPGSEEYGEVLAVVILDTSWRQSYAYKEFYSNKDYDIQSYGDTTYNGKTYYDFWMSSDMGGIGFLPGDNGNITATLYMGSEVVLELQRESENSFKVITSSLEHIIPVGTVFAGKTVED